MEAQPTTQSPSARHFLVTGGLGFIGIHLCQGLLKHYPDCKLTVVDNLSSTIVDYSSIEDRADIHIADLRHYSQPIGAHGSKFTDVFHLASPVGSLGILERHGYIASDILELAHIASDIAATNGARLLYLSSSEVYGRDGQHDEAAEQIVPVRYGSRMEYALGKLTAEHTLKNLADEGMHSLRIVRPFNVVGSWQDERLGFVVPQFFKAALAGKALPVHNNGLQTRSFCDVEDMVSGLIAVNDRGREGETYNVGNPDNLTSIQNLAQRIVSVCESDSPIHFVDPRDHYGRHYLEAYNKMPVVHKVFNDTGWKAQYSLDDILLKLKRFYDFQNIVKLGAHTVANRSKQVFETADA